MTGQNCGIIWVDFTIKDPMTFPWTMSTEDKVKAVNRLLRYLSPEEGGGAVGTRLSGVSSDSATARDFIFVEKVREIVDSLTKEELGMLDPERLGYLEWAESVAEE